ncbi:MAG: dual specificity protein phosphatase family protein [Planctomycetota bacterium]
MRTLVIRLLFLPTLAYNLVMSRLAPKRRWWDRVDEHVILGALPLPMFVSKMAAEGVRAVVNTCAEYRGPVTAYGRHHIEQLRIPCLDFTPPKLEDIERAIDFMREHAARGETIYVHCKAGRGRSATVVLCWLVAQRGISPEEAQAELLRVRPHVNTFLAQREVVQAFSAKARPSA